METMEKSNRGNGLWKILCLLFLIGAVAAGAVFGVQKYHQHKAQQKLEELTVQNGERTDAESGLDKDNQGAGTGAVPQSTAAEEKNPLEELQKQGVPIPEKEVDFEDLQANVNGDIYAWVYIPDTKIDYPVLQHPDNNSYYLKHNLDGSKGYPGCIYTENYNAKDFSDPNTVLYGHNMKNGTMFAGLHKYEDSAYFEEHPYVYIYTPENFYVYEIFAAYEYSNAHLLLNYDLDSEYGFGKYLEEIQNIRSMNYIFKDGLEVTKKNHILTLSTCIADKPDKRYLVQGVLLNED